MKLRRPSGRAVQFGPDFWLHLSVFFPVSFRLASSLPLSSISVLQSEAQVFSSLDAQFHHSDARNSRTPIREFTCPTGRVFRPASLIVPPAGNVDYVTDMSVMGNSSFN